MVHKASSSSLTFPHFPVTSREVILENIIVISSLKSECLWYMGPARGRVLVIYFDDFPELINFILSYQEEKEERGDCRGLVKLILKVTWTVTAWDSNSSNIKAIEMMSHLKYANMTGGSKFFITGSTIHIHTCIAWMEIWTLHSEKVVSSYYIQL